MADIICEEPLSTLTNPGKADYNKKKLKNIINKFNLGKADYNKKI